MNDHDDLLPDPPERRRAPRPSLLWRVVNGAESGVIRIRALFTGRRRRPPRPELPAPIDVTVALASDGPDGPLPLARGLDDPRHAPVTPPPRARRPGPLPVPVATRLPTGSLDRHEAGAAWWRYRRPGGAVRAAAGPSHATSRLLATRSPAALSPAGASSVPSSPGAPRRRTGIEETAPPERPGMAAGMAAGVCLVLVVATGRLAIPAIGRILIPAAGILAAVAFGQMLARRHPDEQWLTWALVAGVVFKLVMAAIRYQTLITEYGGQGDATIYDRDALQYFDAWTDGGPEPDTTRGSEETLWVRWLTGVVYYVFGPDMFNGFLVFALAAVVGAYLWYRAGVLGVPFLNKPLYFFLLFFVPSIVFWPASIGKEALMQLGIGVVTLGAVNLFQNRLVRGLLLAAPGGWLLWRVRPHLLALVVFAAGIAYLVGRIRRRDGTSASTSLMRPVGMVVITFFIFFAVSEGAEFLGLEEFSLSAVEEELNETTAQSDQGGSNFETQPASLSPLSLPQGTVTVLLRPFPWEVDSPLQLLASLESAAIAALIVLRFRSITLSFRRLRTTPLLLYCWTFVLLYAVAFQSFANFGLLVRQRSLVLPALFTLLAIEPRLAKEADEADDTSTMPAVPAVPAPHAVL